MNITIRHAVLSDLDFVIHANNIINDASNLTRADDDLKERLGRDFFPENKTKSNAGILIAEADGVPVGMAVYSACYFMKEGDSMWLSNVYVDEKHRKLGIATKLMEHMKQIAKESNYSLICFLEDTDNIKARGFAIKASAREVENLRLFYIKVN